MAFAKQYFSSYKSNNNLDYYLELWVDGYTGNNPSEISLGKGGPIISYNTEQEDRFSPILSSQCELPFLVTGFGLEFFIQLLRTTYKEKQVYLHLYRATSSTYSSEKPLWSGFLVMDLGSGEDLSYPYEQKLTFVDGLSLLKDIDFVDLSDSSTPAGSSIPLNERTIGNYDQLNMYYGPAIYTFWIKEILKKVGSATTTQGVSINYGFTTAVNWYNGEMPNTNQGSDPLGLTKCNVSMFHQKNDQDMFIPDNCYSVLKELLRHWGARITYWQHEFWIVQIPEYITNESGTLNNPNNINSRQYNLTGLLIGSQDHLGDSYYTRYEQTIQNNKVSKIIGTKYDYLPMINNVQADFLSFSSTNYYGGFPFGANAEIREVYQGTIFNPSSADFLWLSIPLDWVWDMGTSALVNGHVNGYHISLRFNFFASRLLNGTVTTYYLQKNNGDYYWVLEADWTPLGTQSPAYKLKSNQLTETNYVGFQEQIPFKDGSGSPITMNGSWDFFLDIEEYGSSGSNPGSFICNFLGYGYQLRKFDPSNSSQPFVPNPYAGGTTDSGSVSWSNTLEIPGTTNFSILPLSQLGYQAGNANDFDIKYITSSPFRGFLQTLDSTQSATYGISLNTIINNNTNTESYNFGTLLWGDVVQDYAIGSLRVFNGSTFIKTNSSGEWGRGVLTGEKTFTDLLINEFLTGQLQVVISPSMRLAVGVANKDIIESVIGGGSIVRPRYVNPIGILRETRNGVDPVYFFRRGSFYSLYDEWDYEGYQILRDSINSTTSTNNIGNLGGSQVNNPIASSLVLSNVTNSLTTNSPIAFLNKPIPSVGANVAVNGNFNVATGWTLGTGWTIDTTASKAKFAATGSLSSLSQINLTEGTKYQVIFTIDITAGQLTVKAGSSGGSQVITVAGQYELYLLCEGSTSIQFQAGTTFTGSISQVSIADQKSLSSVPIESLGEAVFKTNDTFNLVNSINGEVIPLTVTSNQGATDTAISVTAVPLFDDIGIDSVLLINQDDLSSQYQNKTKGTVAGFDITATGIEKSSINITDWLNSDTMTGATVTNVPTALSVKNYVDGQVGANDTLQEVTDNGNTTTNSIMIGSSNSPNRTLHITGQQAISNLDDSGAFLFIPSGSDNKIYSRAGNYSSSALPLVFLNGNNESMRLTAGGRLGLGDSNPNSKMVIKETAGNTACYLTIDSASWNAGIVLKNSQSTWEILNDYTGLGTNGTLGFYNGGYRMTITPSGNLGINVNNATEKLHVVGDALITGDSMADAFKPAVAANPIKFKNFGSTELARITDGGNLLLGTTSDNGELLQLSKSTGANIVLNSNTGAVNNGIYMTEGATTTPFRNGAYVYYDSTNNLFKISTGTASFTDRLTIDRNTGATTLTGSLTGTTATFSGDIRFTNANQKIYVDLSSTAIRTAEIQLYNGSDGSIQYKTFNASTGGHYFFTQGSEKFRLDRNGNLGLGTTSPTQAKLVVNTTSLVASAFGRDGTDGDVVQIFNGLVGTTKVIALGANGNDGTIYSQFGNLLLQPSAGKVGIGTTLTPNRTLHVYGQQAISNADDSGSFLFIPSASANRIYSRAANNSSSALPLIFLNGSNESMRITAGLNILIGTTTDSGQKLQVTGNIRITGGFQASNTGGFLLADTGGSMRYGLKYGAAGAVGATNLMMLTNRSLSSATGGGEVAIAANASTTGVTETEVMRIKANTQSQVSIDGVLSLTSQNTPADPPNRASTIWLDSNFDLKIKITNNSGVTVTKTIVEYA